MGGASGHGWACLQGFLVVHGSLGRWGQHPAQPHAHGRSQLGGLLLTGGSLGAEAGVDAPLVAFLEEGVDEGGGVRGDTGGGGGENNIK